MHTLETLLTLLAGYPYATQHFNWEHVHVFKIGGKMFALVSETPEPPGYEAIVWKVDPETFGALIEQEGYGQASHFAKGKWIAAYPNARLPLRELKEHIQTSYDAVYNALPKKVKAELAA